jgi:hypothetical protein
MIPLETGSRNAKVQQVFDWTNFGFIGKSREFSHVIVII